MPTRYGLPDWRSQGRLGAALRIFARFAGVRLFRAAYRPAAFDVHRPGRSTLLRRQIAMRRRSMPIGEAAGALPSDHA